MTEQETCAWCGEGDHEETGPVRAQGVGGYGDLYHDGCWTSATEEAGRWSSALVDREAEAIARATGSVGATVRYERRQLDGTLTLEAEGSWTRDEVTQ